MPLSYRQLGEEIAKFSDEQLACSVTVYNGDDEYVMCDDLVLPDDLLGLDILDFEFQPILLMVRD